VERLEPTRGPSLAIPPIMEGLPASLDPPVPDDEGGRVRRVGVEIELTDLDVEAISSTVAEVFGGEVVRENDYLARVETDLGPFRIEADLDLLQRVGRSRAAHPDETGMFAAARDAVASIAEHIAPYEVVSPPVPYPSLPMLDELVDALRARGGHGTSAGVLLALGLQLNPQVPRTSAQSIYAHMRAYAALEPWLRVCCARDVTRRMVPFADSYPASYLERLLERASPPRLGMLIDEYLRYNPTRNRSLDLLPLFAHLDPERVAEAVDDPRIKPRPAFHYRLPDSRLSDPGWRITDEWRHWLVVERAAASPDLLTELATTYLSLVYGHSWSAARRSWPPRCEVLLERADFGLPSAPPEPRPAA
jgi:hypothetical protein